VGWVEVEYVLCSRGFGERLLRRNMTRRYAFAGTLFNVSGLASGANL
jgi:hypothetical protein